MGIRTVDRERWVPGVLLPDTLYRGSAPWPKTLAVEVIEQAVEGNRPDMTLEQLMALNAIHDTVECVDRVLGDLAHRWRNQT